MRLLEPLNGVKMLQGHFAMHIVFFICMWFVTTDISMDQIYETIASHSAPHRLLAGFKNDT